MNTPKLKALLLAIVLMGATMFSKAQTGFAISGVVSSDKDAPIKAATVFLSGTRYIMPTDDEGKFVFKGLVPGSYQLVVKMLGYAAFDQQVSVTDKDVELNVKLSVKSTELREVVIGGDANRKKRLELFIKNFLGTSEYGRNCTILNTDVLNFRNNTENGTMEATADDFLEIENKKLGYTIKYLLKDFQYHYEARTTNYTGDASYQEMTGTDEMKREWAENRRKVYRGSLMHFLRAVYQSKDQPLKEGFLTRIVMSQKTETTGELAVFSLRPMLIVDENPLKFETVVSKVDDSFLVMRYKQGLSVVFDPRKTTRAIRGQLAFSSLRTQDLKFDGSLSTIQLPRGEVVFDSRGAYTNYQAFLIKGHWGEMRVGDQLPFEYQL